MNEQITNEQIIKSELEKKFQDNVAYLASSDSVQALEFFSTRLKDYIKDKEKSSIEDSEASHYWNSAINTIQMALQGYVDAIKDYRIKGI